MRNISTFLISILIFSSCSIKSNKKVPESLSLDTTSIKSKANHLKEFKEEAYITELPFTGATGDTFYTKALPIIDSINYKALNTSFDLSFSYNQREVLNHLTWYQFQLPNLNKFEVYYTELNCFSSLDSNWTDICADFVDLNCGFLMLYNPLDKHAHILNVKNSYYIDSAIEMNFKIDDNYKIHLTETGMTDGEIEADGTIESESYTLSRHLIEVNEESNILIRELDSY